MYKDKKILVTICARGGSKGVKNKNIKSIAGKPLISFSLDLVKQSKIIDEYIVSTDSEDIMKVVQDYGFKILFKRPEELAGDKIARLDVIRHAFLWAEEYFKTKFDVIIDLGVASPLKSIEDMEGVIKMLVDENAQNVFSVCDAARNPYFNMVEIVDGKVSKVKKIDQGITGRQMAPHVYDMNDAFNAFIPNVLKSNSPQFNERTKIFVMPRERSIDIDEEIDFSIAELFLQKANKK